MHILTLKCELGKQFLIFSQLSNFCQGHVLSVVHVTVVLVQLDLIYEVPSMIWPYINKLKLNYN